MPIAIGGLSSTALNWMKLSGVVTPREVEVLPLELGAHVDRLGTRWIIVVNRDADLSNLTALSILGLRKAMVGVLETLAGGGPLHVNWVCDQDLNNMFVEAWRVLAATDPSYPSSPIHLRTLEQACSYLNVAVQPRKELAEGLSQPDLHAFILIDHPGGRSQ